MTHRPHCAEIDENPVCNNVSPVEKALLTARRAELYETLKLLEAPEEEEEADTEEAPSAGSQTQIVSGRKDVKGVRDAGSTRDRAAKSGENRERVRRSTKRVEKIRTEGLQKIQGTSLDKGVELDALAVLRREEREGLIDRATAGEEVPAAGRERSTLETRPDLSRLSLVEISTRDSTRDRL